MEDCDAIVEVSKDKIVCQLKLQGRSIMTHIHPPKALFIQISMTLHQCSVKSDIYLSKFLYIILLQYMTNTIVYNFS
jgi:hypothetical protein